MLESTVWMVHARGPEEGTRGTLTLEGGAVVFRPDETGRERVFPLERIRRARRLRGSPVLELRLARGSAPSRVGFFFVRPPALGSGPVGRRTARGPALVALLRSSAEKRDEISRWSAAIRAARRAR